MRRFRVDFSIRELDVPDDQAQGIRFGDEVPINKLLGFFDRCRSAMRALYDPEIQAVEQAETERTAKLRAAAQSASPGHPSPGMFLEALVREWIGNDLYDAVASRSSEEYIRQAIATKNRGEW